MLMGRLQPRKEPKSWSAFLASESGGDCPAGAVLRVPASPEMWVAAQKSSWAAQNWLCLLKWLENRNIPSLPVLREAREARFITCNY